MHRKSMESLGQLTRLGQVWRVIRVELNDVGAHVLSDHPPLQRERNSSIASTYHVIPVHVVESTDRDGYWRHERRDWLRTLPRDGPGCDVVRAGAIQCLTRRGGRHRGKWGIPFDSDICLDLIVGALRKLCQVEQTLSVLGEECR